ncbi:carbohydrate-binding domain-containing protein [Dehalococcoides mccartyi]|uniref:carbohydrate-binding domain-containing protein n=1 Tax=Dehalococcoides mccartyi TaxID=61435 RepID=UPI0019D8DE91|nr:carbohydrate-binding domain-containing protein [Dehalococcoides mccartyi]MBF4481748.1 carbohydrate-binding domain-containing protein [Dehalococcoides mccartyi]MBJ7531506.1 carbohydrate-binding domain-containing protein [Dehalococcoides mccartyi]
MQKTFLDKALLLVCMLVLFTGLISCSSQLSDTDSGTTRQTDIFTSISLAETISIEGEGVTVDGSQLVITSAGTYTLSGELADGRIIVDTKDEADVIIILNGVNISCSSSSAIYIKSAANAFITLAEGTENYIADGDSYFSEGSAVDEPNAAIFSKSDLTINGNGSLTVTGNYNNGIQSKDDLEITAGTLVVKAVNDGIKGRDSVVIRQASVTIEAGGDGIQSTNDENAEKGFVLIESGYLDITAGEDGVQAETDLTVSGGEITIFCGGGSANSSSVNSSNPAGGMGGSWGFWGVDDNTAASAVTGSAKGLKAGGQLTISGGNLKIDSSDDSLHSNSSLLIGGGSLILSSGDDGIHADTSIEINAGTINILKSYEGIESAEITINGGSISVVSSDDGINVAGGNDQSSINGRPGQNSFTSSTDNWLYINGGYLVINASGDGIDTNGSAAMTGGIVIVSGPTGNDNGALDYMGTFKVSGGYLLAVGSSGMAQAPDSSSSQYSLMLNFGTVQAAGSLIHIETSAGEDILTYISPKAYQSVVICSPLLSSGLTCLVYTGGYSSGTATDGLYSGGVYTGGSQVLTLTISGVVTQAGSGGSGSFPGGGSLPGGGGRP